MLFVKSLLKKIFVSSMARLGYFNNYHLDQYIQKAGGILVVTYHSVQKEPDKDSVLGGTPYTVPLNLFKDQANALKKHFNLVTPVQVENYFFKGRSLPERPCLLSFDDGWKDNFLEVYPVLLEMNIPVVLFLATNLVGTANLDWTHHLWRLINFSPEGLQEAVQRINKKNQTQICCLSPRTMEKSEVKERFQLSERIFRDIAAMDDQKRMKSISSIVEAGSRIQGVGQPPFYLSWEEVRAMDESLVSLGAHGHSHFPLTWLGNGRLKADLETSKQIIGRESGRNIYGFSYPHSLAKDRERRAAEAAGFRIAFCGSEFTDGIKNTYQRNFVTIPRTGISGTSGMAKNGVFSDDLFLYNIFRQTGMI